MAQVERRAPAQGTAVPEKETPGGARQAFPDGNVEKSESSKSINQCDFLGAFPSLLCSSILCLFQSGTFISEISSKGELGT
jgi:hypothetical protein